MAVYDVLNYMVFDNPVSKLLVKPILNSITPKSSAAPTIQVAQNQMPLWELAAQHAPIIRVAGICGASAVALGAYGEHKSYPQDKSGELKSIFKTGNNFHFLHTLALFGVPMCRHPFFTGSLMIVGTALFCGPCYYHAFTEDNRFGFLAPIGGTVLILSWLSMAL
ncbi:hypothetical protein FQA39_LY05141 [Lamprigera yunnana]|nr:hypothetical protein FQA39_LY05141 [Lamprigera yunnana]